MSADLVTSNHPIKIEPQENKLSLVQVREAVPKSLRSNVTQELVNTLNSLGNAPEEGKLIRDNFLSFSDILKNGSYKTQDYINAVIYVSYKIMGLTNTEAYYHTFPDRQLKLKARGASSKDVSAYVAAFNRGELVQQMRNAKSERVRFMAADSLMSHLAKPENSNIQTGVNININSYAGIDDLTAKIQELSLLQKKAIDNGVSTKDIAAQKLINDIPEAEIIEVIEPETTVSTKEEINAEDPMQIARRLFG